MLGAQQIEELCNHLKILSTDAMAGRKFGSVESIQAQKYIISTLIDNKVSPFQKKYRHLFEYKLFFLEKEGTNIIGYVEGTHFPNQYIVLSAHYDHIGKKGSNIYNGADDNASGTAAVLAFSQEISKNPLKSSVIFLFTDGEEVNLLGAKSFINQQKQLLPRIKLNINIDMIAGSKNTKTLHYIDNRLNKLLDPNEIEQLTAFTNHPKIKIKRGFKKSRYRDTHPASIINASDHASFNRKHIPFIYFGVGLHKNYHTIHDKYNNVNLPFFIQATQSIFQYLLFFDENIESFETKS